AGTLATFRPLSSSHPHVACKMVLRRCRVAIQQPACFEMNESQIFKIAGELKVQPRQVAATAELFAEGATVPFIARYRREATGSLDEVAVTSIRERLLTLAELDQRRDAILKSL